MRSSLVSVVLLPVALLAIGCSAGGPPDVPAGCNPLVGDDCLTPFPSSFYETPDGTTTTGVRVQIAPDALSSKPATSTVMRPDRLNQKDGFSPATPFLVYFKAGVDATNLPTWQAPEPSLTATGAVQVIEYATGTRVLAFGELDENPAPSNRQALLVHPLVRLKPGTRYVIALVGLKDASGQPLEAAPFRALRDGATPPASLQRMKATYDEIFAATMAAGIARADLTLAWDVVTASDETATGHLTSMRDQAFANVDQLGYTITAVNEMPSTSLLLREVLATVQVPSFLADDSGSSFLGFDGSGEPQLRANVDVPIIIHVPRCSTQTSGPMPTIVVGHGLFESASIKLSDYYVQRFASTRCAIEIATDWIGLAADDLQTVSAGVIADINNLYVITDRLQQAQVNAMIMTRTFLTKIRDDPALAQGGVPFTDGKEAYYFGISLGGIAGGAFLALDPDIARGALNVAGGEWSLLIFRSTFFIPFAPLLANWLPDSLDLQVAVAVSQSEWDYTDALTFAPHLLADPLPGSTIKQALLQESLGDAAVSNVSTRILARTMGVPGLDLQQPVSGVATGTAPLPSAYTQWNANPSQIPPATDVALPMDNDVHYALYPNELVQQQVLAFFAPDGMVTSVCGGPCDIH